MLIIKTATTLLVVSLSFFLIAHETCAQIPPVFVKRLHSPASVRGFIGGESHDSYVIHVRKGRVLRVRLSWLREGDNGAGFVVSDSPNTGGNLVTFGKWSKDEKTWEGKVPKSRDYYVQVVAHPTAHYTLRVTVK